MLKNDYLLNLNEKQQEAVLHLDGPLLIVAGAGSGKTKVLTSRIAHIIRSHKAFSSQILAVTFTNKAAKEMQNRVMQYIRGSSNAIPWLIQALLVASIMEVAPSKCQPSTGFGTSRGV